MGEVMHYVDPQQVSHRFKYDPDPPRELFVDGTLPDLEVTPTVAIIGSRRPSPYGRKVARDFGEQLARCGAIVISGLASGIDTAAHEGALRAVDDKRFAGVIGVVGCGVDVIYPQHNHKLWEQVRQHGCVMSEYPCGTQAAPWQFPQRNRIIAALADVVIVGESAVKSGTRHTVEAATDRAKPVLAVPGPITSTQSAGTIQLLREGAEICGDLQDVAVALTCARPELPLLDANPAPQPLALSTELMCVYEAVDVVPTTMATIIDRSAMGVTVVAKALEDLVRLGRVHTTGEEWMRLR